MSGASGIHNGGPAIPVVVRSERSGLRERDRFKHCAAPQEGFSRRLVGVVRHIRLSVDDEEVAGGRSGQDDGVPRGAVSDRKLQGHRSPRRQIPDESIWSENIVVGKSIVVGSSETELQRPENHVLVAEFRL